MGFVEAANCWNFLAASLGLSNLSSNIQRDMAPPILLRACWRNRPVLSETTGSATFQARFQETSRDRRFKEGSVQCLLP